MTSASAAAARALWELPAFTSTVWSAKKHAFCVVIPVINEGPRIRSLLTRMAQLKTSDLADIILVDGGSTDGSLAPEWLQQHQVRALLLKTGPGKLSAQLRCAYAFALDEGYEGVVTIDGNDKDDPASIPEFIRHLAEGYDFIQASRYLEGGVAENTPRSRDLAIRYLHAPVLSASSGFRWTDTTQGYRGYRSDMLRDPRLAPFRDVFAQYELLAYLSHRAPKLGYRCIEIPTARRYPVGEVPTKISSIRGNWGVLKVLVKAALGSYDRPPGPHDSPRLP